jgi:G6PDH family F420-dependent oxidoreductase
MPRFGYKLMSEELGPRDLVTSAVRAELAGFDYAAISDHFSPWIEEQGHAPFIWSVLGSIATATEHMGLMTAVTCPTFRYHPAVVAQAAATVSLLAGPGRFDLGLGSGERLNEHVVGGGWPAVALRQERLEEAIDVIELLFEGGECSYTGRHFELADARLFDLPDDPPALILAAGGPRAARIAGEKADGLIATEPRREIVEAYREAGGGGPCHLEVSVCFDDTDEGAVETLHRYARWSLLDWSVLPELPTTRSFDAASQSVRPEDVAKAVPHGPALERYAEKVREAVDAGFDHVILHQVGPRQEEFMRFFEDRLRPALDDELGAAEDEERSASV